MHAKVSSCWVLKRAVVFQPQPATEHHAATHSHSPPRWDGEENWEKKLRLGNEEFNNGNKVKDNTNAVNNDFDHSNENSAI